MRAEIKTGGDEPIRLRVPGSERQVEDRFGIWLGKTKSIGDAKTGMGDRLDAAHGEEPMLGGIMRRLRILGQRDKLKANRSKGA